MNDDLHNIDKLFRDGIEKHEEAVPPLIWEGISSDLDKKQSAHYKSKYYWWKRSALLLLLLCFLGGGYMIYDGMNDIKAVVKQKDSVPTTTSMPFQKEKKHNSLIPQEEKGSLAEEKSLKCDTAADSVAETSTLSSVKKNVERQENGLTKQSTRDEHFVRGNFTPTLNVHGEKQSATGKTVLKNNELQESGVKPNNFTGVTPEILPVRLSSMLGIAAAVPPIKLPAISGIKAVALPEAMKPVVSKPKAMHGFSLSAYVAPNISFDRLEDDDHLSGPGRNRQEAHHNEQENVSFSGGLLVNYELTKKIRLQSGISVTFSSTSIAPKTVYAKADNNGHTRYELNCSSGYVYISPKGNAQPAVGDSAKTSGTNSKLTYVTMPLSLNYRLGAGRFSLLLSVGAGLNVLINGKTKTNLSHAASSESTTASISGLKKLYVDGNIGLGIEYRLNQKLSIGIRPNIKLALTPINKETPVISYQNLLSVETGVRIKL